MVDALDLHDFTLGGHSTGGAIAIRYMARYNGYRVSKLALFAAAAPSLIQRPYFPYGLPREAVLEIIQGTYNDRPEMLRGFGDMLCLFPSAVEQNKGIRNSRLIPFEYSGHGLFYDEREKFNQELTRFIEE